MVDSVQVPALMALLLSPYEPRPLLSLCLVQLQQTHQANGQRGDGRDLKSNYIQRSGSFFFFCQLPFGYKSQFSSGKFSPVEYEGLNAIGFWWKTNQKNNVEIMCFPFLYTADFVSLANSLLVFLTSYHVYRRTTLASVCSEISFLKVDFFIL